MTQGERWAIHVARPESQGGERSQGEVGIAALVQAGSTRYACAIRVRVCAKKQLQVKDLILDARVLISLRVETVAFQLLQIARSQLGSNDRFPRPGNFCGGDL